MRKRFDPDRTDFSIKYLLAKRISQKVESPKSAESIDKDCSTKNINLREQVLRIQALRLCQTANLHIFVSQSVSFSNPLLVSPISVRVFCTDFFSGSQIVPLTEVSVGTETLSVLIDASSADSADRQLSDESDHSQKSAHSQDYEQSNHSQISDAFQQSEESEVRFTVSPGRSNFGRSTDEAFANNNSRTVLQWIHTLRLLQVELSISAAEQSDDCAMSLSVFAPVEEWFAAEQVEDAQLISLAQRLPKQQQITEGADISESHAQEIRIVMVIQQLIGCKARRLAPWVELFESAADCAEIAHDPLVARFMAHWRNLIDLTCRPASEHQLISRVEDTVNRDAKLMISGVLSRALEFWTEKLRQNLRKMHSPSHPYGDLAQSVQSKQVTFHHEILMKTLLWMIGGLPFETFDVGQNELEDNIIKNLPVQTCFDLQNDSIPQNNESLRIHQLTSAYISRVNGTPAIVAPIFYAKTGPIQNQHAIIPNKSICSISSILGLQLRSHSSFGLGSFYTNGFYWVACAEYSAACSTGHLLHLGCCKFPNSRSPHKIDLQTLNIPTTQATPHPCSAQPPSPPPQPSPTVLKTQGQILAILPLPTLATVLVFAFHRGRFVPLQGGRPYWPGVYGLPRVLGLWADGTGRGGVVVVEGGNGWPRGQGEGEEEGGEEGGRGAVRVVPGKVRLRF